MTKHGCFQHESHDFSLDNYETEFVAGGMLSIIIVFNYECAYRLNSASHHIL